MKDNDLSASLTRRYWVLSDVVFVSRETVVTKKSGWFGKETSIETITVPDMAVLSLLWRFSERMGVRMELVFLGEHAVGAPGMWDLLERTAANPFTDWHAIEKYDQILRDIPFRPDLMGIIASPIDSARFGGRGLTIANLH
jgi:hypothetical protein